MKIIKSFSRIILYRTGEIYIVSNVARDESAVKSANTALLLKDVLQCKVGIGVCSSLNRSFVTWRILHTIFKQTEGMHKEINEEREWD